ncbi:DNA methyltransferase, partial [candidate division KSB1 bacterium]
MKPDNINQLLIRNLETKTLTYSSVILNKEKFMNFLNKIENLDNLNALKSKVIILKSIINSSKIDREGLINIDLNGDTVSLRKDILTSELNQILEAKTLQRAKYYTKRLKNGIKEVKTNKINDINLLRWKEYDEIITDSLWILDKRDSSGAHIAWYWGNFIPQIPHQIMLRYTKKRDWVLDTFVGSGTTLIECRRLGRNGVGIELNPDVVKKANELIKKEYNRYNIKTEIVTGDSRKIDIKEILSRYGIDKVQLLIMHPP